MAIQADRVATDSGTIRRMPGTWNAQPFFLDNGSNLACSATIDYRQGAAAGVPVTIYATLKRPGPTVP